MKRLLILLLLTSLMPAASFAQSKGRKSRRAKSSQAAKPKTDLSDLFDPPAEWQLVATATDGVEVYYSPRRTVRKGKGIIRTWIKYVHPENSQTVESSSIMLEEFDCADQKYRVLQVTDYYRAGGGRSSARSGGWMYITPESVLEAVFETICPHKESDFDRFMRNRSNRKS